MAPQARLFFLSRFHYFFGAEISDGGCQGFLTPGCQADLTSFPHQRETYPQATQAAPVRISDTLCTAPAGHANRRGSPAVPLFALGGASL